MNLVLQISTKVVSSIDVDDVVDDDDYYYWNYYVMYFPPYDDFLFITI